jgi:VIT1/CCC1 family predicted Fe2+/Mn2+ transporter
MSMKKQTQPQESQVAPDSILLNKLRAGVLGANDGIVSVSSIIVGVAGATNDIKAILTAGVAGLVAGALSMAVGEYVSVSSQKDSEESMLYRERKKLKEHPEQEERELKELYIAKGLSEKTATVVAKEFMEHDPLVAHAEAEFGITPGELANPSHAAISSGVSFTIGALIPLLATILAPDGWRIIATFIAVLFALILTGTLSAHVGGSRKTLAAARVVIGGILAMAITYAIGSLFGQHGL